MSTEAILRLLLNMSDLIVTALGMLHSDELDATAADRDAAITRLQGTAAGVRERLDAIEAKSKTVDTE
jgi:hypothetical protein